MITHGMDIRTYGQEGAVHFHGMVRESVAERNKAMSYVGKVLLSHRI